MHPVISIITPTFNHEQFIGDCIRSVLSQNYRDWEMIIIDDGSTDATTDVIASFGDERIKYLRQENKGVERLSETYNTALGIAQGDFIAILEGDDFWPADKLESQVTDFGDSRIILSFGYTEMIDTNQKTIGRIPRYKLPHGAFTNTPVGRASLTMMNPNILTYTFPASVIIRKSALVRIGGFQQPPGLPLVDYPTFLRLTLEGEFAFHRKTLGFWRRHELSTTKSRFPVILEEIRKHVSSFLAEHRDQLPLTTREIKGLVSEWKVFDAYRYFVLGRWHLIDRDWESARAAFREGLEFPCMIALRAALCAGVLFSHLHCNFELLFRLLGRVSFDEFLRGDMIVDKQMLKPGKLQ